MNCIYICLHINQEQAHIIILQIVLNKIKKNNKGIKLRKFYLLKFGIIG